MDRLPHESPLRQLNRREWLLPSVAGLMGLAAEVQAAEPTSPRQRPVVLLAADGSGDFGPQTAGTRTAGWQEALDCCVREGLDLYVKGGYAARDAVYDIRQTIRIPAAQDFRIDGGVYVINYSGSDPGADAVAIDSAMNCEYHLGLIVYGGRGAGLRIKPDLPVPIDKMPAFIETQVFSQGIADPEPFRAKERQAGTGLVLDAAPGRLRRREQARWRGAAPPRRSRGTSCFYASSGLFSGARWFQRTERTW